VFVGDVKGSCVVHVDGVWQSPSSHKSLKCQQELVSGHMGTYFQVDGTCVTTCKECDVTLSHVTPHLDIQRSSKVNSCDYKGFLGLYPVGWKWNFDLLTVGIFCYFARNTFAQHILYGLTCVQYPKLLS